MAPLCGPHRVLSRNRQELFVSFPMWQSFIVDASGCFRFRFRLRLLLVVSHETESLNPKNSKRRTTSAGMERSLS
jgi:hypothetical protein